MPEPHEEVELDEHVQHARAPFEKIVAGSMAMIAALLAVVSVLGQHYNTETLLNQQLASDQWSFYQAKDIRRYVAQFAQDSLIESKASPDVIGKYTADAARYKNQTSEIQEKAREYEKERTKTGRISRGFHFGEVFLEVAIVFSSLSILTRRRPLFIAGVGFALIGVVFAATASWF
jgi:hypothetical protein